MKKIILVFIIAFAFFYLGESFIKLSFNFFEWSPGNRAFVSIGTWIIVGFYVLFTCDSKKEEVEY